MHKKMCALTARPQTRVYNVTTKAREWTDSNEFSNATHRFIGERGGLRLCHVIVWRLERNLLYLILLVQMNNLQRQQNLR